MSLRSISSHIYNSKGRLPPRKHGAALARHVHLIRCAQCIRKLALLPSNTQYNIFSVFRNRRLRRDKRTGVLSSLSHRSGAAQTAKCAAILHRCAYKFSRAAQMGKDFAKIYYPHRSCCRRLAACMHAAAARVQICGCR